MSEQTNTIEIDKERLAPCGYCRRCSLHDDPGGCLEVYHYEIELLAAGRTPREILAAGWVGPAEMFEEAVARFEEDAAGPYYQPIPGVTPGCPA